ncbi:urease accessory protein UreD [Cupriavidus sp. SK-3]|uniref:urease accessory protein UreD n=1 Tax=Cupriavidus TaxID=106589 RepID=UPI000452D253|nr:MULTISPECIES: urease accessory protein UreD [Cupriavidus]KDP85698.1 urease accessory protein UreD [Cupriavidus sp. SK-3]MDF3885480.1 urease accessory protein UreD [Cupriavidus basilensis]
MRHPDFPSTLAVPPAWEASLRLRFAARGERSVLAERRHRGPLLVQKPLYPEGAGGAICHVVILHPPAGVAGGDSLEIDVTVEAGAHAVLATPGATKWYKSLGREAAQRVTLTLQAGARMDWLPQENIVFDDAHARLATTVTVAPGASAIGWDAVVLGRQASGETWARGSLAMETMVNGGARPLWIESAQLDAGSALRHAVAGLDGLNVMGTLWAVGEGATQELAEALAEQLPYGPDLRAGVTRFGQDGQSMLLLRVLGAQMEAVRHLMVSAWSALREPIHGVAARPLRLWAT